MHRLFMLEALNQAWRGRGSCAPNPSVGAVAVRNDNVIAKAYHQGAGKAHAERLLIETCGQDLSGATLYVTLEPCNHWGRTPPCVNAIIDAGITRVVYGFADPNPCVKENNTPALLRQEGIEVIYHALDEVHAFYQSYHHWLTTGKPWVTVKMAQTLDGKIAGPKGQRLQLSNASCAEFTHQQRLHSDVILTTVETIINDDPQFIVRLAQGEQKKPLAILDRQLRLPKSAKIWETTQAVHSYHDVRHVAPFVGRGDYHAVAVVHDKLDLEAIITHLGSLGYHDVWVEGGGKLFSALHEQGLVNRTFLYIVPEVLGEMAVSGYDGGQIFKRKHQVLWDVRADNMIMRLDWLEE